MTELENGMHIVEAEPSTLAPYPVEFCEMCGHPMPEGCIGRCADCPSLDEQRRWEWEDFYAWGGWRRAFGEYTDEEWESADNSRTVCGFGRSL
ncbi:MAG TPA: hypothetical protein ENH89_04980 [Aurantimonas coralicida]|uniref:Uncharacterized protein n=1 Tax=Aurantimonas coralicida TaxID=182270 RepID=A0A9C9TGI5_9HYPH|nr:hypothetical protein [Aurantimonas coralicida]